MKYTAIGLAFLIISCTAIITTPSSINMFICAGHAQVFYDRMRNTDLYAHPEVSVYHTKAIELHPETVILNPLYFAEGTYQAKVLTDEQLAAKMVICKSML